MVLRLLLACFALEKEKNLDEKSKEGDGIGQLLGYRFKETRFCVNALFQSGFLPIDSFRFRLCLQKNSLLIAGG